jgi:hypothetical protein
MTMRQILTALILLILIGCDNKEGPCKYICDQPMVSIRIKYLDLSSNRDLIFSSNSSYKVSDLTVYSDTFKQNIPFGVDSLDRINRFILISVVNSDVLTLKLGNKIEDVITVKVKNLSSGCCGSMLLERIQVNQTLSCAPCDNLNRAEPIIFFK